jgi:ABC-type sugar transport system ATPase subunit
VIISHNLVDVFEVATRITVLRLGRNVVVFERGKTTQDEVVRAITFGVPVKSPAGEDTDEGLHKW